MTATRRWALAVVLVTAGTMVLAASLELFISQVALEYVVAVQGVPYETMWFSMWGAVGYGLRQGVGWGSLTGILLGVCAFVGDRPAATPRRILLSATTIWGATGAFSGIGGVTAYGLSIAEYLELPSSIGSLVAHPSRVCLGYGMVYGALAGLLMSAALAGIILYRTRGTGRSEEGTLKLASGLALAGILSLGGISWSCSFSNVTREICIPCGATRSLISRHIPFPSIRISLPGQETRGALRRDTSSHSHEWVRLPEGRVVATQEPGAGQIAQLMRRVADYQLRDGNGMTGNNWDVATFYCGLLSTWRVTLNPSYLHKTEAWGESHGWMPYVVRDSDSHVASQVYLDLFPGQDFGFVIDPTIWAVKKMMDAARNGSNPWSWADALFMSPPLFARLAAVDQSTGYASFLRKNWNDSVTRLFDKQERLFYRDESLIGQRSAGGKKVFWSRANGWAFAGICRTLDHLTPNDPTRAAFITILQQMAGAVAQSQQSDGSWRPNLADPQQFPVPETSGSAFFCYGLAWGINHRILSAPEYLPVVRRAWQFLSASVAPDGRVRWVQKPATGPGPVAETDSYPYGAGALLLAAEQVIELIGHYPEFNSIS